MCQCVLINPTCNRSKIVFNANKACKFGDITRSLSRHKKPNSHYVFALQSKWDRVSNTCTVFRRFITVTSGVSGTSSAVRAGEAPLGLGSSAGDDTQLWDYSCRLRTILGYGMGS